MTLLGRRIVSGLQLSVVAVGLAVLIAGGVGPASHSQDAALIDRLLSKEYAADAPGAAVFVSRGGTVVLKKGYGLADTARKLPATPATVFRLASVTKMFASMAILMLAENGQLALDDPVTKILPSSPASWQQIRMTHLLSHTAGLADYLDRPDSMAWARGEHTVQDLLDAFKDKPASFAPGEKAAYSNSNYILLGAVIEKVSGVSFGRFVKTKIFEPLGMTSTSCKGRFEDIPGLATAYEPARAPDGRLDWTRLLVARSYAMSALYTAGSCVSSVEDLVRFHEGLVQGRVVSKRAMSESLEPARLAHGNADGMSLGGWQLDKIEGRRAVMLGGALPGVCTWFLMMPEEDILVILLSNRTPGMPRCGMLAVQIAGIVAGG
jgi:D-alanyl-D-alanine carboxypeptidase